MIRVSDSAAPAAGLARKTRCRPRCGGGLPEEVVEGEREKREEAETRRLKINEALERLKGAA